ncbi:MAG: hypothetical protein JST00_47535 [Deltaproteobacteria bacterium]|nr:hypothetical protein [Deltaproteobacteria bacterium]
MKLGRVVMGRGVAVLVAAVSACGDAPSEPEAPLLFEGVFTADEGQRGEGELRVAEIELRDGQYRLLPDGCSDVECEEWGTFELDAVKGELRLLADGARDAEVIPFEVDEAEDATSEETSDDTAQATSDPGLAIKNGKLVDTKPLLKKRNVRLVKRTRLLKRRYTKLLGGCSSSQISAAQATCRNDRCPSQGKTSRGLNSCSVVNGRPSFSCACSGASTSTATACGRAQAEFLRCIDNLFDCRDILDCRGRFIRQTDSLDSCAKPKERGFCRDFGKP